MLLAYQYCYREFKKPLFSVFDCVENKSSCIQTFYIGKEENFKYIKALKHSLASDAWKPFIERFQEQADNPLLRRVYST